MSGSVGISGIEEVFLFLHGMSNVICWPRRMLRTEPKTKIHQHGKLETAKNVSCQTFKKCKKREFACFSMEIICGPKSVLRVEPIAQSQLGFQGIV